jgi:fatty-acyl-CoA synthase
VEDALSEHPDVLESLVTLEEGDDGTDALVARVMTRGAVAERDLIAHCGRLLPRWKVPKRLLIVGDLPRTAGGKVRRTGPRA